MNKKSKYSIVLAIIGIFIVGAFFIGYELFSKNKLDDIQKENSGQVEEIDNKENAKNVEGVNSEIDKYDFVHNMVNSIIISDTVWGKQKITKENITKMKEEFKSIDNTVVEHLEKWENLDFSDSVAFHNYVWKKLDGTIGKATGLNKEKIEEVINNLKNNS